MIECLVMENFAKKNKNLIVNKLPINIDDDVFKITNVFSIRKTKQKTKLPKKKRIEQFYSTCNRHSINRLRLGDGNFGSKKKKTNKNTNIRCIFFFSSPKPKENFWWAAWCLMVAMILFREEKSIFFPRFVLPVLYFFFFAVSFTFDKVLSVIGGCYSLGKKKISLINLDFFYSHSKMRHSKICLSVKTPPKEMLTSPF